MTNDDTLERLFELLLAPGSPDINDRVFGYLAPFNRPLFEARRKRLKHVMGLKVQGKKDAGRKGSLVGRLFERVIMALLDGGRALSYSANVRSTTSEIDFLMSVLPLGLTLPSVKEFGSHVLGEAKQYGNGPKHEWVNELVGLMSSHSTRVALLFLGCQPRKLKREIRVAIALHVQKDMTVVPFGETQLDRVANGANFLRVLSEQYVAARSHAALEI